MQNASQAIKEWVELYTADMISWALYKTSHKETAEDLVQETFIAAFQSFHLFENKSKPKTWLFSILKNKIVDYHRKCYKDAVLPANKISEEQSTFLFSYLFTPDGDWKKEQRPNEWVNDSDELLDDPEFNKILDVCLKKLPLGWNAAIQLKYIDEKDAVSICQELGVTTSNYWQIIHRAKLQLRTCLESHWFKDKR